MEHLDISTTTETPPDDIKETNRLFPIFLKLEQLHLLIIGGGNVAFEKLQAVLKNSPDAIVTIVSKTIEDNIINLSEQYNITLISANYHPDYLNMADVVIVAVNDEPLSEVIWNEAKRTGKLINIADTPNKCDFYLSSIVQKGNLKIAISTNGKSPTIAKRIKEELQSSIPDDIDTLLNNMHIVRNNIKGDFKTKVETLNKLTGHMIATKKFTTSNSKRRLPITISILAIIVLLLIWNIALYSPMAQQVVPRILQATKHIDNNFFLMMLAGFAAQLVDGAIGMGYGVTCTTILLSIGTNLPAISRSVNTAKIFSIGSSGYNHYKLGNVNKKLFKTMVVPGVLGAIIGAYLLVKFGDEYSKFIKPLLAVYTMFLGIRIFSIAFKKDRKVKKVKRAGWLAAAGGFLDSFGGGGWGPLVTSTLISKGKTPRIVIGSVNITEAFVALASVTTFFLLIGINHWQVIVGLISGGLIAAPIAAKISGKLPVKTMLIVVGVFVMYWSGNVLVHSIFPK